MSVINKMLRDLDERRATGLQTGLRSGTRVVQAATEAPETSVARITLFAAAAIAVLAAGGAGWWFWQQRNASPAPAAAAAHPVAAPVAQVASAVPPAIAASASVNGLPLAAAQAVPAASPVSSAVAAANVNANATVAPAIPAATPAPASAVPAPVVPEGRAASSQATAAKAPAAKPVQDHSGLQLTPSIWAASPPAAPKPATAAPAAPVSPEPGVQAQRQQSAARDALAQAQGLYAAGSVDAAITLLQDALALAERATPVAPPGVQLSLVRELARMELAQGRAAAVLDLLARVEPLLAGQPDLWAVRANAAQRLGRHQDAVLFYATALQTRPSEQRWLLGSAVSLAALGQLGSAAELAEKARAMGPVSKDVIAYLRQQGVSLPDK